MNSRFLLIVVLVTCAGTGPVIGDDAPRRYVAVFDDGQRVEGNRLSGWHTRDAEPMLDSIELAAKGRRLRWLHDRKLRIHGDGPPEFVEFHGGDRLPGKVVGHALDPKSATAPKAAILLVENSLVLDKPDVEPRSHLRVKLDRVRRICWQPNSSRSYSPNTVFLRSGERLPYRSLRWQDESIRILTEQGVLEIGLEKLAAVHRDRQNTWQAYVQELDVLSPDRKSRLLRVQTTSGLLATASESRFDATHSETPVEKARRLRWQAAIAHIARSRHSIVNRREQDRRRHRQQEDRDTRRYEQDVQRLEKEKQNVERQLKDRPEAERKRRFKQLEQRRQQFTRQYEAARRRNADQLARALKRAHVQERSLDAQLRHVRSGGTPSTSEAWCHMLHPAWSVDPLWIRFKQIVNRWSFADAIPLSKLRPEKIVQRSALWKHWKWRADQSVRQGPLKCDGQNYGWGFGVHATSELHFALPPSATAFRTRVGVDDSTEGGGCVRVAVRIDQGDQPAAATAFQSGFLTGRDKPVDTSWIELPRDTQRPRTLVLIVDSAHQGRPQGADPLDIRDHVNWLEPILRLNAKP